LRQIHHKQFKLLKFQIFFQKSSKLNFFSLFSIQVVEDGDTQEDIEARALLNKFLGATALMTGIEGNSGLSKEFLSTGGASSKNQRVSFHLFSYIF
jgi:hypothetical protein